MKTFLVLAMSALILGAPQRPAEDNGVIEGFVKNSVTGQPVEAARVELWGPWWKATGQPRGSNTHTAETDDNGHFIIREVPPDTYTGRVTRIGYFEGDRGPLSVVIEPRQHIENIDLKLIPGAILSGRVLDSDGRPVVGTRVSAEQASYAEGRRSIGHCGWFRLSSVGSNERTEGTTDDRGEYRIFWLQAGDYYLAAEYHPLAAGTPCRALYPGTFDENAAVPIRVRTGAEIVLDLTLPMSPPPSALFTVSGVVTGIPAGAGDTVESFVLVRRDGQESSPEEYRQNTAADRSAGRFQIRAVPPGVYDLWPIVRTDRNRAYSARTVVQIRDHDIDQLSIAVGPGVDQNGRLIVEGPRGADNFSAWLQVKSKDGVPLTLRAGDWSGLTMVDSSTGQFTVQGLFPGAYDVALEFGGQGLYFADVRQAGKSVIDDGIVVGAATPAPIEVVLSSMAGTFEGDVQDREGKPVAGAQVVFVPAQARRGNGSLYRSVTSDTKGHFRAPEVPPGDYTVFAWLRVLPDGAAHNAAFMAPYERFGVAVHAEAGVTVHTAVTVIPAEGP